MGRYIQHSTYVQHNILLLRMGISGKEIWARCADVFSAVFIFLPLFTCLGRIIVVAVAVYIVLKSPMDSIKKCVSIHTCTVFLTCYVLAISKR